MLIYQLTDIPKTAAALICHWQPSAHDRGGLDSQHASDTMLSVKLSHMPGRSRHSWEGHPLMIYIRGSCTLSRLTHRGGRSRFTLPRLAQHGIPHCLDEMKPTKMYHRGMIYGLNQTLLVPEHRERYADSGFRMHYMVRSIGKVPAEQSERTTEFLSCVRRVLGKARQ